ncbi:MAG: hypothetical protein DRZ90_05195 [Spirochaetes bacterium]|nr:MAG: hypothetical protein DRZ90_05195 [Spirochaetota bacterium]
MLFSYLLFFKFILIHTRKVITGFHTMNDISRNQGRALDKFALRTRCFPVPRQSRGTIPAFAWESPCKVHMAVVNPMLYFSALFLFFTRL